MIKMYNKRLKYGYIRDIESAVYYKRLNYG